jgi:hypothetical protein
MQLKNLGLFLVISVAGGHLLWVFIWAMFENSIPFLSWYALIPIGVCVSIAVVAWAINVLDSDNQPVVKVVKPPSAQLHSIRKE